VSESSEGRWKMFLLKKMFFGEDLFDFVFFPGGAQRSGKVLKVFPSTRRTPHGTTSPADVPKLNTHQTAPSHI